MKAFLYRTLARYHLVLQVERNPQGLCYGLRSFDATQPCHTVLHDAGPNISMFYHHNDIVTTLPSDAESLGADPRCPVHGMVIDSDILTVQGHPEFDTPTGRLVLKSILEKKAIPTDFPLRTPDSIMIGREIVRHLAKRALSDQRK